MTTRLGVEATDDLGRAAVMNGLKWRPQCAGRSQHSSDVTVPAQGSRKQIRGRELDNFLQIRYFAGQIWQKKLRMLPKFKKREKVKGS